MLVYYFGCWNEPGHYLFAPLGSRVSRYGARVSRYEHDASSLV